MRTYVPEEASLAPSMPPSAAAILLAALAVAALALLLSGPTSLMSSPSPSAPPRATLVQPRSGVPPLPTLGLVDVGLVDVGLVDVGVVATPTLELSESATPPRVVGGSDEDDSVEDGSAEREEGRCEGGARGTMDAKGRLRPICDSLSSLLSHWITCWLERSSSCASASCCLLALALSSALLLSALSSAISARSSADDLSDKGGG